LDLVSVPNAGQLPGNLANSAAAFSGFMDADRI